MVLLWYCESERELNPRTSGAHKVVASTDGEHVEEIPHKARFTVSKTKDKPDKG